MVKYLLKSIKETREIIFICPVCGLQTTVKKNKFRLPVKTKLKHDICLSCLVSERKPLLFDFEYFDDFGNLIDSETI